MADHWVSEIFPPKFEFKNVSELLLTEGDEFDVGSEKVKVYEKYNEVYREIAKQEANKGLEIQKHKQNSQSININRPPEQKPPNKIENLNMKEEGCARARERCIWTNEEMRIFRQTFQKLKIQNIHLSGIVDSLTQELQLCKDRESTAKTSYSVLKEKWSELKKRYQRAKISYKSLKEDLILYHNSLKTAKKEVEKLTFERNEVVKELNHTKVSLESERVGSSQLKTRLDEKEMEKSLALQHCEFVTRQKSEFEVSRLKKEIFSLQQELRKEREENIINRKSLKNLRNHFVSSQMKADQRDTDVLNVAEIDY